MFQDALASGAHPLENCIKKHSRRSSQKLLDTFVALDCLSNNFFSRSICVCVCFYIRCHGMHACIYLTFFVSISLSVGSFTLVYAVYSNNIKTNMAQIVKRNHNSRKKNTIECYQYDGKILKIYNYMVNILPAFSLGIYMHFLYSLFFLNCTACIHWLI